MAARKQRRWIGLRIAPQIGPRIVPRMDWPLAPHWRRPAVQRWPALKMDVCWRQGRGLCRSRDRGWCRRCFSPARLASDPPATLPAFGSGPPPDRRELDARNERQRNCRPRSFPSPIPDGDSACSDFPAVPEASRLQRRSRSRYCLLSKGARLVALTWGGRRWRTQP